MQFTYRGATTNTVVAAAGADMFFVISGSASRTRWVRKIRVSGDTLTTLAVGSIVAEKWSSAPTGGTEATLTRVPLDSAFSPAATDGLVQVYTAAPSEGTLVGTLACRRHIWKSSTVVDGAPFAETEFDFDNVSEDGKHIGVPLHGLAQAVSLAFGAAPATAITLAVEVEWSEEAGP